jgi:uncharacterized protein
VKVSSSLFQKPFNQQTIILNMQNKITQEKLKKYFSVTESALAIAKKSVIKGKEKYSKEIFEMVENYLSDAKHFESKDDFVNAFAALNYAHGWLDSGVRLDIFKVKDDKLFTIK